MGFAPKPCDPLALPPPCHGSYSRTCCAIGLAVVVAFQLACGSRSAVDDSLGGGAADGSQASDAGKGFDASLANDVGAAPDGHAEATTDVGADAETDSASCMILASHYDQSCSEDSDCVEVSAGDYCSSSCLCGGSAIRVSAEPAFSADVAKTPLGSGAIPGGGCPCAAKFGPCCRQGTCSGDCNWPSTDTLPACADAGGACYFAACAPVGPANSCAYADETC